MKLSHLIISLILVLTTVVINVSAGKHRSVGGIKFGKPNLKFKTIQKPIVDFQHKFHPTLAHTKLFDRKSPYYNFNENFVKANAFNKLNKQTDNIYIDLSTKNKDDIAKEILSAQNDSNELMKLIKSSAIKHGLSETKMNDAVKFANDVQMSTLINLAKKLKIESSDFYSKLSNENLNKIEDATNNNKNNNKDQSDLEKRDADNKNEITSDFLVEDLPKSNEFDRSVNIVLHGIDTSNGFKPRER